MSTILLIAMTCIITLVPCRAQDLSNIPDSDWVQHFNGENLDNWDFKYHRYDYQENPYNTVSVIDGMINVDLQGRDYNDVGHGVFAYQEIFSHYIYGVEFRFEPPFEAPPNWPGYAPGNNGVLFHCQELSTIGRDQMLPFTFEAQLHIDRTGDLYLLSGSQVSDYYIHRQGNQHQALDHPVDNDGWNRFEVLVLGDSLAYHIMEGDTVMKYGGLNASEGQVCLQVEGQTTWFRRAEVVNLAGCMDPLSPTYREYFVKNDPSKCEDPIEGCMDSAFLEYNHDATVSIADSCVTAKVSGCMNPDYAEYDSQANYESEGACVTGIIQPAMAGDPLFNNRSVIISINEKHSIQLMNMQGREVFTGSGTGRREYVLSGIKHPGMYLIRVKSVSYNLVRKICIQ
jgi:hypothetical protein